MAISRFHAIYRKPSNSPVSRQKHQKYGKNMLIFVIRPLENDIFVSLFGHLYQARLPWRARTARGVQGLRSRATKTLFVYPRDWG